MLDPKVTNTRIGVTQCKAVGSFGMREASGIEIHPELILLGPTDPLLKVFWLNLIAIDFLATKLAIESMQIQSMFARNERKCFFEIPTKFVGGASFAKVVAGDRNTTAKRTTCVFESTHIVPLPAME